ncbi:cobalt-precorrin-6A reductase [Phreatobacter stygius]|uniref:Cobalt-precorrin-6A reductase n=1 Tax=Phreatobacter stygius TaxID=1940610 RepID=A0A4D7BEA4_9HYPH|nr:cobalt-precorrin-6A reductase [Phreatobacter stygius]QCI68288.1 cobalt-precorrin-6A reductase [Phreatobacter stygius]
MTILILGGTTEAAALARRLARSFPDLPALVSLAGRTSAPKPLALPTRTGGFGGIEGLAAFLSANSITAVIDATHPFADIMPFNAEAACRIAKKPLLALRRPPWTPVAGDNWIGVQDMAAAVTALGTQPRRVFLTIGRQELGAFAAAPQHSYLVRSIEPTGDVLPMPDVTLIQARGPFLVADEIALMRQKRIDLVVSKNSGGTQTEAKLAAARALGLAVVMVARPAKPDVPQAADIDQVIAWLSRHGLTPTERGV